MKQQSRSEYDGGNVIDADLQLVLDLTLAGDLRWYRTMTGPPLACDTTEDARAIPYKLGEIHLRGPATEQTSFCRMGLAPGRRYLPDASLDPLVSQLVEAAEKAIRLGGRIRGYRSQPCCTCGSKTSHVYLDVGEWPFDFEDPDRLNGAVATCIVCEARQPVPLDIPRSR